MGLSKMWTLCNRSGADVAAESNQNCPEMSSQRLGMPREVNLEGFRRWEHESESCEEVLGHFRWVTWGAVSHPALRYSDPAMLYASAILALSAIAT